MLPRLRWVAHPPPSAEPPTPVRPRRGPYAGPPGYGAHPPRWGFPAAVWRAEPDPAAGAAAPVRRMRFALTLAVITACFAVVAAGAEAWRFVLLLAGRTRVLSGQEVRIDDALVTSAALILLVVAVAAVVVAVPALVRLHAVATHRAGRTPARRPAEIAGWLLIPGANLWGAGMIVGEIDGLLTGPPDAPRLRPSRLVLTWWLAWVLNGVLVAGALARGLGGSVQAVADTVELHVAVNLSAALVAGSGAAVLARFVRALTPARPRRSAWRVAPPAPTRPAASTSAGDPPARSGATRSDAVPDDPTGPVAAGAPSVPSGTRVSGG